MAGWHQDQRFVSYNEFGNQLNWAPANRRSPDRKDLRCHLRRCDLQSSADRSVIDWQGTPFDGKRVDVLSKIESLITKPIGRIQLSDCDLELYGGLDLRRRV